MVLLGTPRGSADAQAESAAGTVSDELAVAASASDKPQEKTSVRVVARGSGKDGDAAATSSPDHL